MNINRNNCEEFFLLYVDNELSAPARKAVESFILQNPDLEKELILLQQAKLVADQQLRFDNKELLIRTPAADFIDDSNYEECFLLYVDGELNEENKKTVEKFASRYPDRQKELALLQMTAIEPDDRILFERKESLYKREERKFLMLPWLRIAAAVIVLLATVLFVFRYRPANNDGRLASSNNTKKERAVVTSPGTGALNNGAGSHEKLSTEKNQEGAQRRQYSKYSQNNEGSRKKDEIAVKYFLRKKEPMKTDRNMVALITEEKNIGGLRTGRISLQPSVTIIPAAIETDSMDIRDVAVETNDLNASPAIYDQTGNPEDGISILSFSARKNRMRGVFRRVSRIFEKTANADDSKRSVLVGNFQIALK